MLRIQIFILVTNFGQRIFGLDFNIFADIIIAIQILSIGVLTYHIYIGYVSPLPEVPQEF